MKIPSDKPEVSLSGNDSNAFAILGVCKKAAKKAAWTKEQIDFVVDEMTQGDYDHLLQTAVKYFEVS